MARGLGPSGVSFEESLEIRATPVAELLPGTYGSIASTPGRGCGRCRSVISGSRQRAAAGQTWRARATLYSGSHGCLRASSSARKPRI